MARSIDFKVTGEQKIHCAGCEARIETVLGRLPGVRTVQASAQTQRVVVKANSEQISSDQVRAKLEELGYQVTAEE